MHVFAPSGTLCETTQTPRFNNPNCVCATYVGNLGPCLSFEQGANARCVWCDHDRCCHLGQKLLMERETIGNLLEEAIREPHGIVAAILSLPEIQQKYVRDLGLGGLIALKGRPLCLTTRE